MKIKTKYIEPAEYIPEELRKRYKLGEYAEQTPGQRPGTEADQEQKPEDSNRTTAKH